MGLKGVDTRKKFRQKPVVQDENTFELQQGTWFNHVIFQKNFLPNVSN